jgi:uncharacterized membrane protein YfcA
MSPRAGSLLLCATGFAIATVGAMCGIGGGVFTVPLLHYGRKLELKRAVATALVLVLSTSTFSTVAECLRPAPALHAGIVLSAMGGVVLGTELGYRVSERISVRALRGVFFVVLLGVAARLVWSAGSTALGEDPALWLGWQAYLRAAGAGIAGGFIAPLLGLGGGLLMVPLLFFGIPGMGFAEARATALASGTLAAVRSLRLHMRARRVDTSAVKPLALGAIGGAFAGVYLVHLEGVVQVAKVLLAVIMVLVALRFLQDMYKAREEARA